MSPGDDRGAAFGGSFRRDPDEHGDFRRVIHRRGHRLTNLPPLVPSSRPDHGAARPPTGEAISNLNFYNTLENNDFPTSDDRFRWA